ncbi:hypothetical protein GCM10010168_07780 [Actinoplanes ianthinogenes]|uniref:HYR domain-containing protein n=1 Tax=Actinoplanes ianthinogenes TaxID=122358 RepID=A0ABN6CAK3_9ACTN|nr:putative Ig domain-containing protein [Actinoplanes ianthinogenes]BCJ42480.1 hypothetical protein Aiant_31370 [Actinoplanes ianthinogenes]GGQ94361.1 hypothetical protein GCM10010168_07780 [Actinoplanes ianthinogenes]
MVCLTTLLAGFIDVPAAEAATSPVVTNPGTQYSGISVATSLTVAGTGGTSPYTWTATGLPAGLTINAATGVISGTPTTAATYAAKVTATDSAKLAGSAAFSWTTGTAATVTNPGTRASVVNVAVNQAMTATGAKTPYVWSATGLPTGLAINSSTGAITGTPTAAGTFTTKVTATDAAKIPGFTTFTWSVAAAALAVTNPGTRQATTGQPATLTLAATGGTSPYTWAATGLPAGLTLNATSGVVSGTPTTAGTSSVTVTATDSAGRTATATFSWVTAVPPAVTNPGAQNATVGTAFSKTLAATGGTSPYTWTATGLPAGLAISSAGVVSGTPTTAGTSTVTATATDAAKRTGTATFTVTVAAQPAVTNPGTQQATVGKAGTLTLAGTGGTTPYTWTATGLPAGLTISSAGVVSGTATTAGTSTVTVTLTDAGGRTATASFSWVTANAPAITNPGTQNGTTGVAVSKTLAATGGTSPYTWTATGLPAGLTISSAGVVSGTPTTAGSSTVAVTVTDATGRASSLSFTWAVATPLVATKPSAQNGTTGVAGTLTLAGTGGTSPYTWTATGLPAGLSVSTAGVVSGTPTTAGTATVTATVTDAAGRTSAVSFTWTVATPLVATNPGNQSATTGVAGTLTLTGTGGTAPYAWTATGLPTGMTVSSAGVVSGTPAVAGDYPVTATVTDAAQRSSTVTFALTVKGPVVVTSPGAQNSVTGAAVDLTLAATGGSGVYTWSALGLPDGLSISAAGVVSGTLTAPATWTVTLTATDNGGRSDKVTFDWNVSAPIVVTGPRTQTGIEKQAASATFAATGGGGTYTWSATGLPGGLTIDAASGAISGTVTGSGVYQPVIRATDAAGRTGTLPVRWDVLAAVASAPIMDAGSVGTVNSALDAGTNGVAVIGSYAYVTKGLQLLQLDKSTGASTVVAGAAEYGCVDGTAGSQARFNANSIPVQVVGSDGRFVYLLDSCGLRRVDPASGATTTLVSQGTFTGYARFGAIAGKWLYLYDNAYLWRYDLITGGTPTQVNITMGNRTTAAIAADDSYAYLWTGEGSLWKVNVSTGAGSVLTSGLTVTGAPTAMLSVGDYVYASFANVLSPARGTTVLRISKSTGATLLVSPSATDTTGLSGVTGMASDGTKLYLADRGSDGSWLKTLTSATPKAPAAVATAPVMDAGSIGTVTGALDSGSNGVAVIGSYAYVNKGLQLLQISKATGASTVLAGTAEYGCVDGSTGAQVRFNANSIPLQVIGSDGRFVYLLDSCGVRRIDPANGATTTVISQGTFTGYARFGAIAGKWLYLYDNAYLWRYDLTGGTKPTQVNITMGNRTTAAIAADDTYAYLWTGEGTLWKVAADNTTGTGTAVVTGLTVTGAPTAMLSVGDYLYASFANVLSPARGTTVLRISKSTGATLLVSPSATDTTGLSGITGMASDGTKLYLADRGSDGSWLKTLTSATAKAPAAVATAPVMDAGSIGTVTSALDSGSNGVAVIGSYAYVNKGLQLLQVNKSTGASSVLAGAAEYGCVDGSTGGQVRFNANSIPLQVIGSDGRFVYLLDSCGVRRIDPANGATTTVISQGTFTGYARFGAIAGKWLYLYDNAYLWRYDLTGGTKPTQVNITMGNRTTAAIAADDSYAYLWTGEGSLWKVNASTGAGSVLTSGLTVTGAPTAMLSVGDYVYASFANVLSPARGTTVLRISKSTGATLLVSPSATDTTGLSGVTGMASDGTRLYLADRGSDGSWLKTLTSATPKAPAAVATAPVMDAGSIGTVPGALDAATNGVAVIGSYAYVNKGLQLLQVNKSTGASSVLAGAAEYGCVDGSTGGQVRFNANSIPLQVIGSDGRFVYLLDSCGVRRIDPANGATTTVISQGTFTGYARFGAIAGKWLYLYDNAYLWRYDLTGGTKPTQVNITMGNRTTAAIAADDSYAYLWTGEGSLWKVNASTGAGSVLTSGLTVTGAPTAMLSVGDYVYASFANVLSPARGTTVLRISKSTGTTLLVSPSATDTTGLSGVTGMASDGTRLFLADRGSDGSWLKTLTSATPKAPAAVATAPIMNAGVVTTVAGGFNYGSNGVALLGSFAYMTKGLQLMQVNKGTGTGTAIAGAAEYGCVDGSTGAQVRFNANSIPLQVIGSDGRFVYLLDSCGVRRIDPANGATTTVISQGTFTGYARFGAIAGKWLYLYDNAYLWRYDLTGGTKPTQVNITMGNRTTAAIAADDTYAYLWTGDGYLWKVNADTGAGTVMATGTGSAPSAMLSVGDYVYAAFTSYPSYRGVTLQRAGKSSGVVELVAGNMSSAPADGLYYDAGFAGITGLASDGTRLYVADSNSSGGWLRVIKKGKRPVDPGGPTLPGETTGGGNPAECIPCSQQHGDPVNTDTGALTEPATDLTVADRAGSLEMSRTYSSAGAGVNSVVGYGWAWPYGVTAQQNTGSSGTGTSGTGTDVIGTLVVRQENGSTATFSAKSTGSFAGAPRLQATAVKNADGTLTFARQNLTTMVFSAAGQLLRQVDVNGQTVSNTYDSAGRPTEITGDSGRKLRFTYDAAGYLASVTSPAGATVTYTHDADGNLTSVTDPTGAVTSYGYGAKHLLTKITNPAGGVTTNVYDESGRVIKQTDPLGRVITFGYVDGDEIGTSTVTITAGNGAKIVEQYLDGQLRSQTKAAGTADAATTTWDYDPNTGQPVMVTAPDGSTETYAYDSAGHRTSRTDALGRTTTWTYDAQGNELTATDPAGHTSSATYDTHGNQLTATDAAGGVRRWTYNADSTLDSETAADGTVIRYTYDAAGNRTGVTGPSRHTTTYGYNADGKVTSVTGPTGGVTTTALDGASRITKVVDPAGGVSRFAYDGSGRRTSETDAEGDVTTRGYDLAGQPVKVTDANGNSTTSAYDEAGQLTAATDQAGHTTRYEYDLRGNRVAEVDPLGRRTTYRYDLADRLLSTTLPSGATTSTTYDAAGEPVKSVDAKGKATTYTYDALGQMTATTDADGRTSVRTYTATGQPETATNPDGSTQRYTYDAAGHVLTFTDADGNKTAYTYDSAGREATRTAPGNLVTRYTYATDGSPDWVTTQPDGTTVTRTYNSAGRLARVDYSDPATADITFTYDAAGRRRTMTDGTGTTTYAYDAFGRLTATTDGAGNRVGLTYDAAGQLTGVTYPGGKTVTYTRDDAGQLTAATDWTGATTRFGWTADGQVATQTTPNGVVSTTTYDPNEQATDITVRKDGAVLGSYGYLYDDAGQIIGDRAGTEQHDYTYSGTAQLASTSTTAGTGSWADGAYTTTPGGALTGLPDGTKLAYNAAQQLTQGTGPGGAETAYTYDGNGNRLTGGAASYRYTSASSLAQVTTAAGTQVGYTTNGSGLRQTRTVGGTTERFVWAALDDLPVLLDDGTHLYLYGPGSTPYAQVSRDGTVEYLHQDRLGSVRLITGSTGAVVGTTTFDPYGNRTVHTGTADSRIGYTGNWTDPVTGLVYLRARDYDPATGQFVSVDPLVDVTRQPYSYVENNPLLMADPTGLCGFWCHVGTGTGIAVVVVAAAAVACAIAEPCGAIALGGLAVGEGLALAGGVAVSGAAIEAGAGAIALGAGAGAISGLWESRGSQWRDHDGDANDCPQRRGTKGKSHRGGKKSDRDNWFGYDKDREFVKWVHRVGKKAENGGDDIDTIEDMKRIFDRWVQLGKPKVK